MKLTKIVHAQCNELSAGPKKVALSVIEDPKIVAMGSAKEVGKMIGGSESTVIPLS